MRSNPLIDTIYKVAKGKPATKVTEKVRNMRLVTCRTCIFNGGEKKWDGSFTQEGEKGLMKTGNCKLCGCFVDLKTEYAEEGCPTGKW